jgi:hypothetical protein
MMMLIKEFPSDFNSFSGLSPDKRFDLESA